MNLLFIKNNIQTRLIKFKNIFKKDFIIGLDIGTTAMKLAKCVKKINGISLSDIKIVEIKFDIQNVSKEKVRLSALKKILKGINIKKSKFIVAINCPNTAVKNIIAPYIPKRELEDGIRLEAKSYFPFPTDEAIFDFEILGEVIKKGVKKYKLSVVTSPKETVDKYVSLLSKVGIKPFSFVPIPLTLQKIGEKTYFNKKEIKAVLDIGERFSELVILSGNELVFQRKILVAGGDFTKSMTCVLTSDRGRIQLTLDEAERIKKEVGLPFEGESKMIEGKVSTVQVLSMLRSPVEQLVNEIERCFDYYREEAGGGRVDFLILFGGGALLKGLDKLFSEKLAVKVKFGNPLDCFDMESNIMDRDVIVPQRLAPAVGAALTRGKGVNLLPPEIKYKAKRVFKHAIFKSIIAAVIMVLIFTYVGMKIQLDNFKKRIIVSGMELASLTPQLEHAKLQGLANSILEYEPFWADVFMELSNLIPDNIYITRLSMRNNLINIRGMVISTGKEEHLLDFMLTLEKGLFQDVRLVLAKSLEEKAVTEFELICWVD